MSAIAEPIVALQEKLSPFEEEVLHCSRCGNCRAACPLVRVLSRESAGARGKISLVEALLKGELEPSPRLGELMAQCLTCGSCTQICPQGVHTDAMVLAAREGLAKRGLIPEALRRFGEAVRANHNVSGEANSQRLLWAQNLEGGLKAAPPGAPLEVVYFVGCVGSFLPSSYRVPQAFASILKVAGVAYGLLGEEEWCCGYPLFLTGMSDQAREEAEHNLRAVKERGASRVVMACPSCYYAWKELYPSLLGATGVEALHSVHFLEELISKGALPLGELPLRATYHDPCDLGRKGGAIEAPRRILRAIPGLELVEMADHGKDSLCCGGGSNLETYDPSLVGEVAKRRLDQALATGAEAIVTACTQCERTLTGAARRAKARIRVMDIAEVVWRAVEAAKAGGERREL